MIKRTVSVMMILAISVWAKELPKKEAMTADKEIRQQNTTKPSKTFVKQEAKWKKQYYPRGNIATH